MHYTAWQYYYELTDAITILLFITVILSSISGLFSNYIWGLCNILNKNKRYKITEHILNQLFSQYALYIDTLLKYIRKFYKQKVKKILLKNVYYNLVKVIFVVIAVNTDETYDLTPTIWLPLALYMHPTKIRKRIFALPVT